MNELTVRQIQSIESFPEQPIEVLNPKSQERYVLVPESAYARLRPLLDLNDYDPEEGLAHMNEVMAEDDANDPLLESYQKYERQA